VPIRVILDTDIGTDVDDCLALALILASAEIQLEGVTCVYGDVLLRARMGRKLLRLAGRDDVPVFIGAEKPLLGRRPVYWAGHEGVGLLEEADVGLAPAAEHAVDYLVRTIRDDPGQVHLIAVGPLTNVALAFLREPRLAASLAHLTIMGGVLRGPDGLGQPYAEHNVRSDAEAAHVVLAAGAPITLVPLDVTTRVRIRAEDVAQIRAGGTPFQEAVAHQVELYPPFRDRGYTFLHDPLAAATVARPDLVETRSLHVDVELAGDYTSGATLMRLPSADAPANAEVALGVDAPVFEAFLVSRLAAFPSPGGRGRG
jgi:purine nucleosidase